MILIYRERWGLCLSLSHPFRSSGHWQKLWWMLSIKKNKLKICNKNHRNTTRTREKNFHQPEKGTLISWEKRPHRKRSNDPKIPFNSSISERLFSTSSLIRHRESSFYFWIRDAQSILLSVCKLDYNICKFSDAKCCIC